MRSRPWTWFVISLLCFVGAYYCWKWADTKQAEKSRTVPEATTPAITTNPASIALRNAQAAFEAKLDPAKAAAQSATNRFAYRLNNTSLTVSQLEQNDTAILLANALIDTSKPLNFSIPDHLKSHGDPGTYLVQSRGKPLQEFRDALAAAGGKIISYFPVNTYQVRLSVEGARQMAGNPLTQTVMPFEPYYKLQSSLLGYAVEQKPMPLTARLNVLVADDALEATRAELKKLNAAIMKESSSPFGRVLTVRPQLDSLPALAQLSGVVLIEKHYERAAANDLTRQTIGVSSDSVTTTNYLNLTGSNVIVMLPDSGVDITHPDLLGRVFGPATTDLDGHGTHVAGILAGNGAQSLTVMTNVQGSVMPATNQQFRGVAPLAKIMSVDLNNYFQGSINHDIGRISDDQLLDAYFQEAAALTNALILNASWGYADDYEYDLAAANWDWATRDSLPGVTGSQPVLSVFAIGNAGGGDDDGGGGFSETIQSPATSKNNLAVGASEHPRNITNEVQVTEGSVTNIFTPWLGKTDTDYEVASFSGRGNVGIGVEGDRGRYKPDVVAPGTMIISTRSQQLDESFYYNPTNVIQNRFSSEIVDTNFPNYYPVFVPENAVGVRIRIVPNGNSPIPFPNLPIYVSATGFPDPNVPGTYDFSTMNNRVSIPPDGGGSYLQTVAGFGFTIAVADSTNIAVSYDVVTTIFVTNNTGNYYQVLSNLNSGVGPWYRYESGTSMAAPAVSGTLALMQEFFAGLNLTPSPALMKALLINGARPTGFYNLAVQNTINFQGWGLINLPNTLPPGITSLATGTGGSMYFLDQSPTNALVTGSAKTYNMTLVSSNAADLPLRITLAWTDPPGNPSAAIKLVNDLNLVVTNLDDPLNPVIYYGNDITAVSSPYNVPEGTNAPVFDAINNVENVYLPPNAGTNFTITVIGHRINVNAVTAHANDVAQDYALVISSGNGEVTNAMTVTTAAAVYTIAPNITIYTNFATLPLLNQHVGASSPMLGLNTVPLGTNTSWAAANGVITLGQTNQWHFYVVTNTTSYTNAAFVTFIPPELSVSRIGVRESDIDNATRGEADIDLYVSTNPNLFNLDPAAVQAADKSVTRGGTEFIAYQKPLAPIYYIGVKSEGQLAAEFAFYSVFSEQPFSQRDPDGNLLVRGINVPTIIPDGSPADPGVALVLALAIEPVQIRNIIITNLMTHEDFGDLVGTLSHNQKPVTLNNHTFPATLPFGSDPNQYLLTYDDSEEGSTPGTQHTDGPGRLLDYVGDSGMGLWLMSQVDNALSHTGTVNALTIKIVPHLDTNVVDLTVQPNSFAYDSIDVPVEATNLTIMLTFRNGSVGPVDLYVRRGDFPTQGTYDQRLLGIVPLSGTLTIDTSDNPPLNPGRYYVGVFNPSLTTAQDVRLTYTIGLNIGGVTPVVFASTNTVPILDDAVTYATTYVDTDKKIARVDVGVAITHLRVSDLALTLISPKGTRVLLSENRGGLSVDGMGGISYTTNAAPPASSGDFNANTNILSVPFQPGILWVDYNFFIEPDSLHVYYGDLNNLIFDSGLINGTNRFTINLDGSADSVILVMNEGGNTNSSTTLWNYTATAVTANQNAFTFTENTNRAKLPIKFASTPFTNVIRQASVWHSSFEDPPTGVTYFAGDIMREGWLVETGNVDAFRWPLAPTPSAAYEFDYMLDINGSDAGRISTNIATVAGRSYVLSFAFTKNWGALTFPRAEVLLDNVSLTNITASMNNSPTDPQWQTASFSITPNSSSIHLTVNSLSPETGNAGVLFDAFDLQENETASLYYLPEESLDVLKGESAEGDWKLEMWDNRVGATNPIPVLAGWSLQFIFDRLTPAPTLPFIADTNINEGILLTVTNTGSSLDTNQLLTYSVISTAPGTNQPSIDANGVIRWTPDESQGPGLYTITTTVSDSQSPKQTVMNSFMVFVREVNVAPVFSLLQTNYTVSVNSTLFVTNAAIDSDIPANFLGYKLLGPTNSVIDPITGVVTFTPDNSQVFNTYLFTTIVTDTNPPALTISLSATNYFFVFVTPPNLTNGVPITNSIPPGGFFYYAVNVPTNADFATNILLFATGPLNMFFNQTNLPTGTNAGDFTLLTNSLGGIGSPVLGLSTTPPLIPGSTYYLGLQNTNSFTVTNAVKVDFHLVLPTPIFYISDITYTNIGGTNGFLLTWFAPTNQLFQVQWTPGLAPATWTTFTNPPVVAYDTFISPTNSLFTFFDNGSETGGFDPTRYYRLILLGVVTPGNTAPVLPVHADRTLNPLETLTVTNTATDADIPVQTLSYTLLNPPAGATISNNGVIIWTPTVGQAGTSNNITTVVTDSGVPNLSATNTFAVIVNPLPTLSVTYTNIGGTNGFLLTWYAPTNDLFKVEFTDSLFPVNWQSFSNIISYSGPVTPTNGLFSFFDDGSQFAFVGPRFYRLILLGVVTPGNTAPVLPVQADRTMNPLETLTVTNMATDAEAPPQTLSYTLLNPPAGATIDTNGVISWTPTTGQAGTSNNIITVVTDSGVPNLSATNTFAAIVNPLPTLTVTYTNTGATNGFLLTWYAPTNYLFRVEFTDSLFPVNWQGFSNIIAYTGPVTPTNGLFSFFDDGSQYPFVGPRFYRLILLGVATTSNTAPVLPVQVARTLNPLETLVVTNMATDAEAPPQTLSYVLLSAPAGAGIDASGLIMWTPTSGQADTTNLITTVVTDDGVLPLSATNSFTVIVNPTPTPTSILLSHWPLNENAGILTQDIGPAHNDGILTNTGTGTIVWTNGIEGSAVALTGMDLFSTNGGFVKVGNPPSLNFESTNKFSISAWMKTTNFQDCAIVGKMTDNSIGYEIHYFNNSPSNLIAIWLINDLNIGQKLIDVRSGIPVNDGNWHQVAFTYDGSGLAAGVKIYVDGALDPAPTVIYDTLGTNTIQNTVSFNMGSRNGGTYHYNFTGSIDDVQVYNTNLTSAAMLTIFQNPGSAIFPITPPSNFTITSATNSFILQWNAPLYEAFKVQWTTNLTPVITWTPFPDIITSTNGTFMFTDTNAPVPTKFYQLLLLP